MKIVKCNEYDVEDIPETDLCDEKYLDCETIFETVAWSPVLPEESEEWWRMTSAGGDWRLGSGIGLEMTGNHALSGGLGLCGQFWV